LNVDFCRKKFRAGTLVRLDDWDAGDAGVAEKPSIAETLRRTSDAAASFVKGAKNFMTVPFPSPA
jgi:hypothetical protein